VLQPAIRARSRVISAGYTRREPLEATLVRDTARPQLDLAVIGFENHQVLQTQIERLRRHLADDYRLTVFDNSPTATGRHRIRDLCRGEHVSYVGLPRNPHSGRDPSASHGLALNWAYARYLRPEGAPYIGVLDPDVFPARDTSVVSHLEHQPFYGARQDRGDRWYLWPGLAFFRQADCPRLDFRPWAGLDTGGRNWKVLFRHHGDAPVTLPEVSYLGPHPQPGTSPEQIGDWIHTANSSGWRGSGRLDGPVATAYEQGRSAEL